MLKTGHKKCVKFEASDDAVKKLLKLNLTPFKIISMWVLYLCHQEVVLHPLPRFHDTDNGCLDLVLPVVVHSLPRLSPFRVRFSLFSSN